MKRTVIATLLFCCSLTYVDGTTVLNLPIVSKTLPVDSTSIENSMLETILDQVVVTATRTPQSIKKVPVLTQVFSTSDINRSQSDNVQDLLTNELPGLEFGCSMNGETSLQLNGLGGNAVLFLVDGERLAGETLDNVDYGRLDLQNVASVEIVKGAASALYGSNAVAGVINLISKENVTPWSVDVNSRYSSERCAWRYGGRAAFRSGNISSTTSVQYTRSSTLRLTDIFDTQSQVKQVYGGPTLNLRQRLVCRPIQNLTLTARGSFFTRESQRDTYNDHYRDYSGGLKFSYRKLDISYGYDSYEKYRYQAGERTHDHDYRNVQHVLHALYTHPISSFMHSTYGADYTYDKLSTYQFVTSGSRSQHVADAFVQVDATPLNWLNLVGSVRYDYYSASASHALTARLAAMTQWKTWRLRTNYAGGFRAPTLKEMYMNFDMAGLQMIYGNPNLKPERSHYFSFSVEKEGHLLDGSYSLIATGAFTTYQNRITTVEFDLTQPSDEGAQYYNEGSMTMYSVDAIARYRTSYGLGLMFNYIYLCGTGRTIDSPFSQLRPHTATWNIDYQHSLFAKWRVGTTLSGRYLSEPDTNREFHDGAYQLWKWHAIVGWKDRVSVNFTIDNLFNYRPKVYYWNSLPTAGRSWSIGISVNIS